MAPTPPPPPSPLLGGRPRPGQGACFTRPQAGTRRRERSAPPRPGGRRVCRTLPWPLNKVPRGAVARWAHHLSARARARVDAAAARQLRAGHLGLARAAVRVLRVQGRAAAPLARLPRATAQSTLIDPPARPPRACRPARRARPRGASVATHPSAAPAQEGRRPRPDRYSSGVRIAPHHTTSQCATSPAQGRTPAAACTRPTRPRCAPSWVQLLVDRERYALRCVAAAVAARPPGAAGRAEHAAPRRGRGRVSPTQRAC